MERQEAIDFIYFSLDKGCAPGEITDLLSRQLGAPREIVDRFVAQIVRDYAKKFDDQPIGNSAIAMSSVPVTTLETEAPAMLIPDQPGSQMLPTNLIQDPSSGDPTRIPDPNPKPGQTKSDTIADKTQLESFIVRELSKHTKPSDIALNLCEFAGMDYPQAQKLISRIAAQNHKQIVSNQNKIVMPLTIIATLAGLVLLSAGIFEAFTLRFLITNPGLLSPDQISLAYDEGRELLWAFVTGSILFFGGLVGFILAFKKQLE